jgi:hypothetical protein
LSIYDSTALCWNFAVFEFLDHLHGQFDSLDEWLAHRKAATSTQDSTNTDSTQTSIPWVRFEPTSSVFERAKTVHALDRATTVIGFFLVWT